MIPLAMFVASLRPPPAPTTTTTAATTVRAPIIDYHLAPGVTKVNPNMAVYISTALPPAIVADASAAVAQINLHTGAHWTIARGDNHVSPDQVQIQYGTMAGCPDIDLSIAYGCTRTIVKDGHVRYAEINLAHDIPAASTTWVLFHEEGHAVGLEHSSVDVMRPGLWTWTTYQPSDIAGLEALR